MKILMKTKPKMFYMINLFIYQSETVALKKKE